MRAREFGQKGSSWLLAVGAILFGLAASPAQEKKAPVDFTRDILPIFRAHCLSCHAGSNPAGGLLLSSFEGLKKGGVSGSPLAKRNNLLVRRILGQGGLPRMPMGFKPLDTHDIDLIKAWIARGAPKTSGASGKHWAFVPPQRPPVPMVKDANWRLNPIDAFVFARLDREGLKPSSQASKTTLIRRVTLDLIGLPPSPAEVDAFLADLSANAYEKVVDRLLASPHYGERMALPWLDAARYADSNGFQQDGDTFQYVWRDWVVRALNENMPFDKFTIEQLAGDLLPDPSLDQLVATAFNRNHMLNGEGGAIPEEQRNVNLFDRVDTTSTTWMGLTMACARCHDHKYDPITQRDYFSLMAFFNNVPESGVPSGGGQYRIADPWIYAGTPSRMAGLNALESELAKARTKANPYESGLDVDKAQRAWEPAALATLATSKDEGDKAILEILKTAEDKRSKESSQRLREYFLDHGLGSPGKELRAAWKGLDAKLAKLKDGLPRVMVMSDKQPRKTHLLFRGNYEEPKEEMQPASPSSLPKPASPLKDRLGLAKWLVSRKNPLTARVQVNRAWQIFFGYGLVRTDENFGIKGEPPSHPELMDWLAVEFASDWNVKRLHKLIVMSKTYRQSSRITPQLLAKDPENRLYARQSRFRLPSLILRDVALASSGLLDSRIGGKPVYPYQPKDIWDGLAITFERDFSYPQSKGRDNHRRSLYTFWRRTVSPGNMFDASTRQVCTVRASRTSSPLHALTMLNDVTWVEASRALASRILRTPPRPSGGEGAGGEGYAAAGRLSSAFLRVCSRRPRPDELKVLLRSLDRSLAYYRANPEAAKAFLSQGDSPQSTFDNPQSTIELAAYASVCLAIYNLNEAVTRE